MKRTAVRLLTLSLPLAACLAAAALYAPAAPHPSSHASNAQDATQPADELDAEEYAVLSAILHNWERHKSDDSKTEGRTFLILDMTRTYHGVGETPETFYAELKQSSKELLDETVEDFKAKNRQPHKLAERFDAKVSYLLISAEEVEWLFKEKGPLAGWEEFYKTHPKSGGFVSFSRVGFNSNKTQALVYQSHGCGATCGGGAHLLFVKKDGVWVEKGEVGPSWIS